MGITETDLYRGGNARSPRLSHVRVGRDIVSYVQNGVEIAQAHMEFSPKALRYVLDALRHYQELLDRQLEDEGLSDDQSADLANDRQFVAALAQDLQSTQQNVHHGEVPLRH